MEVGKINFNSSANATISTPEYTTKTYTDGLVQSLSEQIEGLSKANGLTGVVLAKLTDKFSKSEERIEETNKLIIDSTKQQLVNSEVLQAYIQKEILLAEKEIVILQRQLEAIDKLPWYKRTKKNKLKARADAALSVSEIYSAKIEMVEQNLKFVLKKLEGL